jgi:hypothetical protein
MEAKVIGKSGADLLCSTVNGNTFLLEGDRTVPEGSVVTIEFGELEDGIVPR